MANQVDTRVVRMEFDNGQFQDKVDSTMKSIKNLDESLKFENGEKGLVGVQKAVDSLNLEKVANDVESLNSKFSVFGVAAASVIANLATRIADLGMSMVSAVTLDPIKDGFAEYELQLNSIQTIMTNTKKYGTTIEDVNKTLGELNDYADLTIYNFGDMTRAIGQFTQSGLDLETSTKAIKGMSNLAAGSGANVGQLSNAMYQLSQALAAGKVQLMDWRSMINANMGSATFQESLKMVSREFGTGVDEAIAKYGDFNQSLKEGWLTSEVMIETLNRLTVEGAESLDESVVANKQYWIDQARAFEDAATKIKTFPQLIDVIKEELGSGWATSWTYIMGNFEEAKELFTAIGTPITTFISHMHDARNEVLKFWHDVQEGQEFSGRDYFLQGLGNIVEAIWSIIAPVADAFNDIFSTVTFVVDEFGHEQAQLSEYGHSIAQGLVDASKAFADFTAGLKLGEGYYNLVHTIFEGIFFVVREATNLLGGAFGFAVQAAMTVLDGLAGALNVIFDALNAITAPVFELATNGFNLLAETASAAFEKFAELGEFLKPVGKFVGAAARAIGDFIKHLAEGKPVAEAWDELSNRLGVQWDVLTRSLAPLTETIGGIVDAIRREFTPQTDELGNVVQNTWLKIDNASKRASAFIDGLREKLGPLIEVLKTAWNDLKSFGEAGFEFSSDSFSKTTKAISDFAKSIIDGLGKAKDAIVDFVSNLDFKQIAVALSALFGGALLFELLKIIKMIRKLGEGITGILELPASFGEYLEGIAKAKKLEGVADIIKSVAIAIAVLAGSLVVLSLIPSDKLITATACLGGLIVAIGLLALALNHFLEAGDNPLDDIAKVMKAATGLLALGAALLLMAGAIKLLSTIDIPGLAKGIIALGFAAGILVGTVYLLSRIEGAVDNTKKVASSLLIFAAALGVVALACLAFTLVPVGSMLKAGAALLVLVGAAYALSKISSNTGSFLKLATSLGILAAALGAIAAVCLMFYAVPLDGMLKAGAALIAVAVAIQAFSQIASKDRVAGIASLAGSMATISASLGLLALACLAFSRVGWDDMAKGGLALGALVVALVALGQVGKKFGSGGVEAMAASMTAIASAVGILALALMGLSLVPFQVLLGSVIGLGLALGVIIGAAVFAEKAAVGLFVLSKALAAIGVGVGAVGLGMLGFAIGLTTLAALTPAACAGIVAAFSAMGEGLIAFFSKLAVAVVGGLKTLFSEFEAAAPDLRESGARALHSLTEGMNLGEMGAKAAEAIGSFLSGIAEQAGSIAEGGVKILVGVAEGISSSIGTLVNTALELGIAFIQGLADGIRNNSGPFWEAIGTMLLSIGAFLAEGLAQLVSNIPGFGPDAAEAIRGWADSIVPAAESVANETVDAADPKGQIAENMGTEMDSTAEEMDSGFDVLKLLSGDASDLINGNFDLSGIPSEVSSSLGLSEQTMEAVPYGDIMSGKAQEAVNAFASQLQNLGGQASSAATGALDAIRNADFAGVAKAQGSGAYNGFTSGINASAWRSTAASAAGGAAAGVKSKNLWSTGNSVGSDLGKGLIAGINAKKVAAYLAGFALGAASARGVKAGSGSRSPSIKTKRVGRYLGQGLLIGMASMRRRVVEGGSELGADAANAVQLAAQALDGFDLDATPVIRPVLDATGIESGLASIFGARQAIDAGAVGMNYAMTAGAVAGSSSTTNDSVYNFYLQYDAGADATEMVYEMARQVRQTTLAGGR